MRKNEEETKMRCVDRKGNEIGENAAQGRVLKALYETAAGRILLGILVKPFCFQSRWIPFEPAGIKGCNCTIYKKESYRYDRL